MKRFEDDASIARIGKGLIDRTLPKSEWTHAAHFAAALWLLRHQPDLAAPHAIRRIISRYNEATSTPNNETGGYHHTITLASMRAAAAHLAAHPPNADLCAIANDLLISPLGHPDWLLRHWTRETLFSLAARRAWVPPDLTTLPF